MTSPFRPSSSQPGHGVIDLALLPPSSPVLRTLSYQYPLKLISPAPVHINSSGAGNEQSHTNDHVVHTVYLLTYGGGLVAGDTLNLSITLAPSTRLILLTQGSTKIFNTVDPSNLSLQHMVVDLHGNCALVYLPDPVQPFAKSSFEQSQIYRLHSRHASLCALDWVCQGRAARGEAWNFWRWGSRNEIWLPLRHGAKGGEKLLLRDNVFLTGEESCGTPDYSRRLDGLGVFGTLILFGPLFEGLGKYFLDEYRKMPRIGARNWGDEVEDTSDEEEKRRKRRHEQEIEDRVLWTASSVRGTVLVKVGAREVEGIKKWLSTMLKEDGSVIRNFGERSLLCLR